MSIGDQSIADASISNITRLPMLMHIASQQFILWKVEGKGRKGRRKERRKGRNKGRRKGRRKGEGLN